MHSSLFSHSLIEKITTKTLSQELYSGLYIVSTPIGNLLDITFRAVYILRNADVILAEDTRQTRQLCAFFEIPFCKVICCNQHLQLSENVIKALKKSNVVALVSDAGTPLISDPGKEIVQWCNKNNISVYPVPGACSAVAAICTSPIRSDSFCFMGFLPSKGGAKIAKLKELKNLEHTMIFLESPNRVVNTLQAAIEIFGERQCHVCRELTKIFEEHFFGTLQEVFSKISKQKCIGEYVIIIAGNDNNNEDGDPSKIDLWREELIEYIKLYKTNIACKMIADKFGINKSIVYKHAIAVKNQDN